MRTIPAFLSICLVIYLGSTFALPLSTVISPSESVSSLTGELAYPVIILPVCYEASISCPLVVTLLDVTSPMLVEAAAAVAL